MPINYIYNGMNYTSPLGNYWDDYYDGDGNSDGIGDTPYYIEKNEYDYYPLTMTYENYIESHSWDLNSDNVINVLDLIIVAMHFGSYNGDENYLKKADLNSDNVINVLDLIIVAMHFGERYN